jgi:hypothetical protein
MGAGLYSEAMSVFENALRHISYDCNARTALSDGLASAANACRKQEVILDAANAAQQLLDAGEYYMATNLIETVVTNEISTVFCTFNVDVLTETESESESDSDSESEVPSLGPSSAAPRQTQQMLRLARARSLAEQACAASTAPPPAHLQTRLTEIIKSATAIGHANTHKDTLAEKAIKSEADASSCQLLVDSGQLEKAIPALRRVLTQDVRDRELHSQLEHHLFTVLVAMNTDTVDHRKKALQSRIKTLDESTDEYQQLQNSILRLTQQDEVGVGTSMEIDYSSVGEFQQFSADEHAEHFKNSTVGVNVEWLNEFCSESSNRLQHFGKQISAKNIEEVSVANSSGARMVRVVLQNEKTGDRFYGGNFAVHLTMQEWPEMIQVYLRTTQAVWDMLAYEEGASCSYVETMFTKNKLNSALGIVTVLVSPAFPLYTQIPPCKIHRVYIFMGVSYSEGVCVCVCVCVSRKRRSRCVTPLENLLRT